MSDFLRRWRFVLGLIVLLALGVVFFRLRTPSLPATEQAPTAVAERVTTATRDELEKAPIDLRYTARVSAERETVLTAQASGIIETLPIAVGSPVAVGQVIATIDDTTSSVDPKNGYKSTTVQDLRLARDIARKDYQAAEKAYDKDDSFANRMARDSAKLAYERAQLALTAAEDARTIRAPFSGTISRVAVDRGSQVAIAQDIAVITTPKDVAAQFYVDAVERSLISASLPVVLITDDGTEITGKIVRRSDVAESETGRFLVEAVPTGSYTLRAGQSVSVDVTIARKAEPGTFYVPLKALKITPSAQVLFRVEGDRAVSVPVVVDRVVGSWAQIRAEEIGGDTRIIIDGAARVYDGAPITVSQ